MTKSFGLGSGVPIPSVKSVSKFRSRKRYRPGALNFERYPKGKLVRSLALWEERFYKPPPHGSNFRDCECARTETKASIHHPLWVVVVVVYKIALPTISNMKRNTSLEL